MSRFAMLGLLTAVILSLGVSSSFAQVRGTTTNAASSGTRTGLTGAQNAALGAAQNSAFGNQNSAFGAQNSAFGNQNSAFGTQNSAFGNQNSGLGNTANAGGRTTGTQTNSNPFGTAQGTSGNGQQGTTQQQGAGQQQQGFGQQGANTGLGNTNRTNNALGGGGGNRGFGGTQQFNPFQAAAQRPTGPSIQPSLRLGFQPPVRPAGQVSENLETRMQQVSARPGRLTEIKPEFSGVKINVANDGVVTLRGEVTSEAARRLAANMIRIEPGVRKVVNELAVVPTPATPATN